MSNKESNRPYGSTDYMKWAISLNNDLELQKEEILDLQIQLKDKDKEIEELNTKLTILDAQIHLINSRLKDLETNS